MSFLKIMVESQSSNTILFYLTEWTVDDMVFILKLAQSHP